MNAGLRRLSDLPSYVRDSYIFKIQSLSVTKLHSETLFDFLPFIIALD